MQILNKKANNGNFKFNTKILNIEGALLNKDEQYKHFYQTKKNLSMGKIEHISKKRKYNENKKVISFLRNNLTDVAYRIIINIGDENVKKRNVFIKDTRFL